MLKFSEDMEAIGGCIGGCFNMLVALVIAGTLIWLSLATIIGALH